MLGNDRKRESVKELDTLRYSVMVKYFTMTRYSQIASPFRNDVAGQPPQPVFAKSRPDQQADPGDHQAEDKKHFAQLIHGSTHNISSPLNRGKTSNIQHRTSNAEVIEDSRCDVRRWMFNVGCSSGFMGSLAPPVCSTT